jgi:hypothetical protein
MLFPNPPFPTASQEFEACLTIVLRNLRPENWADLLGEAQTQMIKETELLLDAEWLSAEQALQLVRQWQALAGVLTPEQWSHIRRVVQTWQQTHRFSQRSLEREVALLLKDRSPKAAKIDTRSDVNPHKVAS